MSIAKFLRFFFCPLVKVCHNLNSQQVFLWSGESVWFCPVLQLYMVSTDRGWLTVTMTSVPSKDQQWTSAPPTGSPVKTKYKVFFGSYRMMMMNIKTWQISRSFQAVWRTDVPSKCALWQSGTWQRVTLLSSVSGSQQPTARICIPETLELLWPSKVRCSQHPASQNHQHDCSWSIKKYIFICCLVPDIQIKVMSVDSDTHPYKMSCEFQCRLSRWQSYIWYRNGEKFHDKKIFYAQTLNPEDQYSCSVSGYEASSPAVCEFACLCYQGFLFQS